MALVSEIANWRKLAAEMGVEIVTPVEIVFRDGAILRATALVKDFGVIRDWWPIQIGTSWSRSPAG